MLIARDENFDVMTGTGTVLVDFYSKLCGPCMMLAPILSVLEGEFPNISFVKSDIEETQENFTKLGVISVPTLILMKDGQVVSKFFGFKPKTELVKWLKENT